MEVGATESETSVCADSNCTAELFDERSAKMHFR
jgi:hypothetical protein